MSGYLLDTHTLLWFDTDFEQIPTRLRAQLRDLKQTIYVSAISYWELTIKNRIGKLPEAAPMLKNYRSTLEVYGFIELPFTIDHAVGDARLRSVHKDPFDRALAAQAVFENLTVVTKDPLIAELGAKTRW